MLAAALLVGCKKPPVAATADVQVVSAAAVPADPSDPAWNGAPEHVAKLLLQDMVEPRLLSPSTAQVRVRAIASGSDLALRLEWTDSTHNDVAGPGQFSDGCAIQLPSKVEPGVPAPQMGEPGKPVEIVFWNAAWQAEVGGRGDSITALYPNASIDHYPFEAASLPRDSDAQKAMAARYAPARALGNPGAGPHTSAVQDLVAQGPGTLTPAPATASTGRGARAGDGWSVVIVRKLPAGLTATNPTQIALAVWDGAGEEAGARKMRTGWIPLTLKK
jgi:DMSO reductase family type II enzyme heme b subunit